MANTNDGIVLQEYPDEGKPFRTRLPPLPPRGKSTHTPIPDSVVMPTPAELAIQEARAKEKRLANGRDA